jgi:N-acetylglucosamine-6-phosphate deacetylase
MLGLAGVGVLAPGSYADLVELSDDLEVSRVMRRGAWVPMLTT